MLFILIVGKTVNDTINFDIKIAEKVKHGNRRNRNKS